jgi:hypothetical protein
MFKSVGNPLCPRGVLTAGEVLFGEAELSSIYKKSADQNQ